MTWPAWLIPLSLVCLTVLTIVMLVEVRPAIQINLGPVAASTWQPADLTREEAGRIADGLLLWSALTLAVLAVLGAATAVSLWIIWQESRHPPKEALWQLGIRIVLMILIAIFGASVAMTDFFDSKGFSRSLAILSETGLVQWPIDRVVSVATALTAITIAALFSAATVLVIRGRLEPGATPRLYQRLQWLLGLGTLATVLGVLVTGAVNRLHAIVTTASQLRCHMRTPLLQALNVEIAKTMNQGTPSETRPSGERDPHPILTAWAKAQVADGVSDDVVRAYADMAARTKTDGKDGIHPLANSVVDWLLISTGESDRVATASALASVSTHMASFFGLVFTLALSLLYLPAAVALTSQRKASGPALTTEERGTRERFLNPLLRILAAIAPFLAGILADFLKLTEVFAGE